MIHNIPVYAVCGWSGSGKTTFIEGLIPELRKRGLRVAVVKHDAHDFSVDRKGKDTFRFTQAGAEVVAITSGTHSAIMENRFTPLEEFLTRIHDVDVIIAEGFKSNEGLKRIRIRRGNYELPDGEYIAVISDVPFECDVPVFDVNDYCAFAEWLITDIGLLRMN
ncbi:MAG: molybdopterin-guanine dinucleotide biosynthesis protein B [Synergistaceae bacterium]|nr:molybdopterin-guanine dinucleotide biosynthesis protein B [Synergistaceae bacterium]